MPTVTEEAGAWEKEGERDRGETRVLRVDDDEGGDRGVNSPPSRTGSSMRLMTPTGRGESRPSTSSSSRASAAGRPSTSGEGSLSSRRAKSALVVFPGDEGDAKGGGRAGSPVRVWRPRSMGLTVGFQDDFERGDRQGFVASPAGRRLMEEGEGRGGSPEGDFRFDFDPRKIDTRHSTLDTQTLDTQHSTLRR
jgi:hypothetical protein